jgi:hypothetical protein
MNPATRLEGQVSHLVDLTDIYRVSYYETVELESEMINKV